MTRLPRSRTTSSPDRPAPSAVPVRWLDTALPVDVDPQPRANWQHVRRRLNDGPVALQIDLGDAFGALVKKRRRGETRERGLSAVRARRTHRRTLVHLRSRRPIWTNRFESPTNTCSTKVRRGQRSADVPSFSTDKRLAISEPTETIVGGICCSKA